jgi:hypothetical protein
MALKEIIMTTIHSGRSWHFAVGIVTAMGLDGQGDGIKVRQGYDFVLLFHFPDRFLCPPSLSKGYQGLLPRG